VNLGIFPDSTDTSYAYSAPVSNFPAPSNTSASVSTDRLAAVDQLLRQPAPSAAQPRWQPAPQPSWVPAGKPTQIAYLAPVTRQQLSAPSAPQVPPRKIWLQLASGANAAALPGEFERIRSKDRDLFEGITGYVAKGPDRARLVIGPFHGQSDAETFADDLQTVGVNAFKWSNSPADEIVPLGTE
jgi:cell division protein FtsN